MLGKQTTSLFGGALSDTPSMPTLKKTDNPLDTLKPKPTETISDIAPSGSLPVNKEALNCGFGKVAPSGGGLFGGATTKSPDATSSLTTGAFGAGGGLFGAKPAETSGGLFGSSTTGGTGGGLFGGATAAAKTETTGGGLFGGASTTTIYYRRRTIRL